MILSRRTLLAAGFAIAACLEGNLAYAQDPVTMTSSEGNPPPKNEEAAQHFKRGLKLFDDGDFKLALVEFDRSYQLVNNFRVLYNLGEVQFQLNNYALAMKTLTRYLEEGGDKIPPTRRAEVERDLENLRIRIGYVRVNVDVDGAEILVDGERIGRSPMMSRELVDAGAHRISVQKLGFTTTSDALTLVGGDDKTITVHLVATPKEERRIIEVHDAQGLGPVWVGWGLTVALGIATVGTGVAWQNNQSKLTDLKNSESSSSERQSQAHTVDTLGTVTYVLGGATLVAAGVSLFFTLRRSGSSDRTTRPANAASQPAFNVGLGQLTGQF